MGSEMCIRDSLYTEAADAWSTAVIEEIQAKTSLAVWKSTSAPRADNSSLSRFSAMTRPSWLGRAARNRHRHAIEQASRRWRGGQRDDSARTRRKNLISTQVLFDGADVKLCDFGLTTPCRRDASGARLRFPQRAVRKSTRE